MTETPPRWVRPSVPLGTMRQLGRWALVACRANRTKTLHQSLEFMAGFGGRYA
jgi:hypothetical protein